MPEQSVLFDAGWLVCSADPWAQEFAASVACAERDDFVDPAELVWDDFDSEVK
jgi:hypothetical protein